MRRALLFSLALVALPRIANAHLIPDRQGTLNVVDQNVFAVLSMPVSALHGFDDDGDRMLSLDELRAHQDALRSEVDERFSIRDGTLAGETARIDLVLSPQHEAPQNSAEAVVALKHVTFPGPPNDLRLRCDLFGTGGSDPTLTFTATRHPEGAPVQTETAVLTSARPEHRFFQPRERSVREAAATALTGSWRLLLLLVLALAAAGAGWRYFVKRRVG